MGGLIKVYSNAFGKEKFSATDAPIFTGDKSLLDQGQPVAGAHQLELDAREGRALAVELRRDRTLTPGAVGQFKAGPERTHAVVDRLREGLKVPKGAVALGDPGMEEDYQ